MEYTCVGTLQCIVLAVQGCWECVLYVQEGYSMSGGVEGRGDGECVRGRGQIVGGCCG